MIKIIKVAGNSLSPFFLSGDFVFINTSQRVCKKLQPDDTVVFNHPVYGRLIKRVVVNNSQSENIEVSGYNEDSVSSHKLGLIPYSAIIGKVIYQVKRI